MLHFVFIAATWLVATLGIAGAVTAAVAIGYLGPAAAMAMFSRFIACITCVVLVVFLVSTVFSYWVGRWGEYDRGYARAISDIAAEDAAAIARAKQTRSVWQECRSRDGQWDQSTGECK